MNRRMEVTVDDGEQRPFQQESDTPFTVTATLPIGPPL